ncbi:SDR family oxidoreductase [Streptomyces sp. H10-C2]|uniref:SDR family NAD(P)-dependent oxidoreductase n=1 Tax=unclassified Streptomyces TaxID=2593676 RepID=UPI0024BBC0B9|nr:MULTISPECIES: SDR family NAD(P)-dependent oxidoreductase [unclassified Streptomyces]MDJ0345400.1 SDR family oxidoreductase [Streptomyces sp. PH10-H1]MDJ0375206.1 SDR family oxidoreductase [Streptomyces sp. H10-C2]
MLVQSPRCTGRCHRLRRRAPHGRGCGAALRRLHAAFNNAGYGTLESSLHETADEVYERAMDVNVRGVWNCMKHQLPVMLASGSGSIVNTISTATACGVTVGGVARWSVCVTNR